MWSADGSDVVEGYEVASPNAGDDGGWVASKPWFSKLKAWELIHSSHWPMMMNVILLLLHNA